MCPRSLRLTHVFLNRRIISKATYLSEVEGPDPVELSTMHIDFIGKLNAPEKDNKPDYGKDPLGYRAWWVRHVLFSETMKDKIKPHHPEDSDDERGPWTCFALYVFHVN
jgi:hypothetical protein